jgi:hypothetical protein
MPGKVAKAVLITKRKQAFKKKDKAEPVTPCTKKGRRMVVKQEPLETSSAQNKKMAPHPRPQESRSRDANLSHQMFRIPLKSRFGFTGRILDLGQTSGSFAESVLRGLLVCARSGHHQKANRELARPAAPGTRPGTGGTLDQTHPGVGFLLPGFGRLLLAHRFRDCA